MRLQACPLLTSIFGSSTFLLVLSETLQQRGLDDSDVCLFGLKREPEQATPEVAQAAPASSYHWWRRGGNSAANSGTDAVGPDLSKGPSWVWQNELNETLRHSPLIDDKLNIYLQSSYHIRKLTADGKLLWSWKVKPMHGILMFAPVLHDGRIYTMSTIYTTELWGNNPVFHVLDMETGEELLQKALPSNFKVSTGTPSFFVEAGRLLAEVQELPPTPISSVVAFDINTLEKLWVYRALTVVWNFMPASVGDGTVIFSGACGKVMRIRLSDGKEVWSAGNRTAPMWLWCSTAGGVLGGDGNFYTEYNHIDPSSTTASARIAAFRVSDGKLLWKRSLGSFDVGKSASQERRVLVDYGGWQSPAVGFLGGKNQERRRALVVAIGGVSYLPPALSTLSLWPEAARESAWHLYLNSPLFRKNFMDAPDVPNAVVALDAASGGVIWRYELPSWDHYASILDEANFRQRVTAAVENPTQTELICLPNAQGIPVVDGEGTVYASDGHMGGVYAIKDANEDGVITNDEVTVFETGAEFLNSPSLAPGLMAAAPCWGDMYVFRS